MLMAPKKSQVICSANIASSNLRSTYRLSRLIAYLLSAKIDEQDDYFQVVYAILIPMFLPFCEFFPYFKI